MKRSLKVSGLLSALSLSLFGVSVVGCSAEGTPNGEALGTTSQAQGTFTPASGPTDLQFMGEFSLDTTLSSNKISAILIIGGYDKSGAGQTTAGILRNTGSGAGSWTPFVVSVGGATSPLPTALGEVEVAQITASKFLVAGGRATRDASAKINAWVLTLNVSTAVASWTAVNMGQARVIGKNNLLKCGSSGDRFIAIGGMTNGGMEAATTTATDSVEVFNYNGGTPSWSALVKDGTATVIKLPTNGKGYHQVLSANVSKFIIAGGANSATTSALSDVQILTVDNTCEALSGSVTASNKINTSGTALPSARARAASIKSSGTADLTFNYDFIIAGGNDTSRFSTTPPSRIFFYNSTNNNYYNNSTPIGLTSARVFPRLVKDEATSTSVRMATGVVPNGTATLFDTTPSTVNIIDNAAGVTTTGTTAITNGRVGSAVQLFGLTSAADYAAFGTAYQSTAPTSTAKSDVFDF